MLLPIDHLHLFSGKFTGGSMRSFGNPKIIQVGCGGIMLQIITHREQKLGFNYDICIASAFAFKLSV